MRQLNRKTPLVFKIGVLLLCAMLITSYLMSGLYARYTVTATASDSARVARFAFDSDLETQAKQVIIDASQASFYPGQMVYQPASITNNGEVAIRYVLKLDNLTNNLPITDAEVTSAVLAPGDRVDFVISIPWPAEFNSPDFAGKMDIINITVSVEQVD